MNKAYDRLGWNFIQAVIIKMEFPRHWVSIIKESISIVSYQFLLNGTFSPLDRVTQYPHASSSYVPMCFDERRVYQGLQWDQNWLKFPYH